MLIKHYDPIQEARDALDYMPVLEENFGSTPNSVIIQYNDRLGKNLVQLESFLHFAECNGITDAGIALVKVCEANKVPMDEHIGFSVNESSIYARDSVLESVNFIQENGYSVAVAPISKRSIYYQALEEALSMDEESSSYENSINLRIYTEENVLERVSNKIGDTVTGTRDWVRNRAERNWNNAKETLGSGVDATSKKVAALTAKARELKEKISRATGEAKVFLSNQLDKVQAAINKAREFLSSQKSDAPHQVNGVAQEHAFYPFRTNKLS